jgi:formate hydrogenlyase transcriptional activator
MTDAAQSAFNQIPIQQYQALLEVSESIARQRDLSELFRELAGRLHQVVRFDYLNLILHDAARNTMRLHVLQTKEPTSMEPGFESPIDETPAGWVWQNQQPYIIRNVEQESRYPRIVRVLKTQGVRSACLVPLTSAQRRLGALGFGSREDCLYGESELEFMKLVARQVAVAVDNALNFQSAQSAQRQLEQERNRLKLLLDVTNAVNSTLDVRQLFAAISSCLRTVLHHDYASLSLYDQETRQLRLYALDFPESKGLLNEEMSVPVESTPANEAFASRKPVILVASDSRRFPSEVAEQHIAEGLKSGCCVPLITHEKALGTLNVGSRSENFPTPEDLELLSQVANQIAIALENALAYRQIAELKDKLAEEKLYLEDEIRTEYDFEEIIGESQALKRVLQQVETVAPTDSTVLIQGETGTGKELIARAIHNLSSRRDRTFVKLNCAAIPTGLLESELFGHEKGAFTGAISQKIGRFELAHHGTIFLDEVGDIPLELQPKLLRVLQEQEFERLGSNRTIRVHVRLVVATNRDLARMVEQQKFRNDLFYRLNVFPIQVPPLRERREDIPLLIRYFTQKFARRMDKRIESIPAATMEMFSRWHWPGNIRELENFIERAVILSRGMTLHVPLGELAAFAESPSIQRVGASPRMNQVSGASKVDTLKAVEWEHVLRVLEETDWVIGGPSGAAARLGLKRTTLQSRMRKLGISRKR